MVLAAAAYDNRDVVVAAERLDDVPEEQRGWQFSADGTRITTGSFEKTAKVWSAPAATPLIELKGHTDDTRIVTVADDESSADLAFLALAQHQLGQPDQARDTLTQLRLLMNRPQPTGDQGANAFLREAETIELD